jgi:hypothetical protein
MDRATLHAHRDLWGQERENERHEGQLLRLRPEEGALYDDLIRNQLAERLRLEQERISFGWLRQAIAALDAQGSRSHPA